MGFQGCPIDIIPISELSMDSENQCISSSSTEEKILVSEYMDKYQVYELTKSILEMGLFPNESLIISEEDMRKILANYEALMKIILSGE